MSKKKIFACIIIGVLALVSLLLYIDSERINEGEILKNIEGQEKEYSMSQSSNKGADLSKQIMKDPTKEENKEMIRKACDHILAKDSIDIDSQEQVNSVIEASTMIENLWKDLDPEKTSEAMVAIGESPVHDLANSCKNYYIGISLGDSKEGQEETYIKYIEKV